jgi:hypothetical protein
MPVRLNALKILLVAAVVAALAPAAATAAPRMLVGFQDDPTFRWRPDRTTMFDRALQTNARILKTTVYWYAIAPNRPARATDPFDKGYYFEDLDDFVRNAQARGFDVLMSIWGTPGWANGNKGKNRLPTRLSDLTSFSRALASRYSGRYPGFGYVGRFAIWNESNLEQFLAPQFDASGRSVGPANYAKLYRAAYAGIKAGNRAALVAAGETSARGRDRFVKGLRTQQTHSPGRFAELVSKARPAIRFDAWSHHPYPTSPNLPPTQRVRWPNVTLPQLTRFEQSLDGWFRKRNIPIWITEYGHETRPEERLGVTRAKQAAYADQALSIVEKDPRVQMFIWFVFRDDPTSTWQSGLLGRTTLPKPAFLRFARAAARVDAWNPLVRVRAGFAEVPVRVPAFEFLNRSGSGQPVQVNWQLSDVSGPEAKTVLADQQTTAVLARNGFLTFRLPVTTERDNRYEIRIAAFDVNGNRIDRRVTLTVA